MKHVGLFACGLLSLAPIRAEAAQAGEAVPLAPAASDSAAQTKELRRVLHLDDGRMLRGKTRLDAAAADGAVWEVWSDGEWRSVKARHVVRVEQESAVLERSRSLLAKVGRAEHAQRVIAADWMLREGLVDEALRELEKVLEADPDHVGARRLLAQPPIPLSAPGAGSPDPRDLVRHAAVRPRVVQELALAALAKRDAAQVRSELEAALRHASPEMRAFAALGLRRLQPSELSAELINRSVLDANERVRAEAARALRDRGEEGVILPVVRALASSYPAVRENAAEALGAAGYAAAVEPLVARLAALSAQGGSSSGWRPPAAHITVGRQIAYVQDYDVEVAQFSSIGDPQVNVLHEASVLDVRVLGVYQSTVAVESRAVRGALRRLTKANPGDSNKAWLDWWERNRASWGGRMPQPPTTTSAGPRTTGGV